MIWYIQHFFILVNQDYDDYKIQILIALDILCTIPSLKFHISLNL